MKTQRLRYLKLISNKQIINLCERVLHEVENPHSQTAILLRLYFCEMYLLISRIIQNSDILSGKNLHPRLRSALNYIHGAFDEKLSIPQIAKSADTSTRHLSRLFLDEMGLSVMDYVLQLKISKAKELLKLKNSDITCIAHQLGFTSSQYFSTCFKKVTSMSPKQYRSSVHG